MTREGRLVLALCLVVGLSCVPGPNPNVGTAGFWLGLWHGLIAPITFIISLFKDSVSVYEVQNRGGWYDLGFLLGMSTVFGGGGHGSARRRRRWA